MPYLDTYNLNINGLQARVLVDSGASVNFVSPRFAAQIVPRDLWKRFPDGISVRLGDGTCSESVISHFICLKIFYQSDVFAEYPAVVSNLDDKFDIILGKSWLKSVAGVQNHLNGEVTVRVKQRRFILSAELINEEGNRGEIKVNYKSLVSMYRNNELVELFSVMFNYKENDQDDDGVELRSLKSEFQEVFDNTRPVGADERSRLKDIGTHKIVLNQDCEPVTKQPYRMSPRELEEVQKQLKILIEKDMIRPSASPWAAPVIFAKKKDGTLRMCVDYRALNRLTKRDTYPIPRVDDNVDRLGGCSMFSTLDLEAGFHQIRMEDESIEKTAFNTRYGKFEYKVMPFGLCNAPSTFQRVMNLILKDFIDEFCVVYIDDILVYSKDRDEHLEHLRKILNKLREYGLILNVKKSRFFKAEVNYLGYIIAKNNIRPDPEKVSVVKDWSPPKSVTEVRSFIGLLNYYRRFIKDFTKIALPLLELTKKEKEFKWDAACQESFDNLKIALISSPVLIMPDYEKEFHIWPDASQYAVGGVLTQKKEESHQPIAFYSSKLSPAEQKYSTTERELYAMLLCLRKFRCYVEGREIKIHTDHRPLTWAKGLKDPKPRIWSWLEEIEYFLPQIEYVPGERQPADALSRLNQDETNASVPSPEAPSTGEITGSLLVDRTQEQAEKVEEPLNEVRVIKTNGILNNVLEYGPHLESSWPELVGRYLAGDPEWSQNVPEEIQIKVKRQAHRFKFFHDKLHCKVSHNGFDILVPYLALDKREETIMHYHEVLGHLQKDSINNCIRLRHYWPGQEDDICRVIQNCAECQLNETVRDPPLVPLHPLPPAPLPFQRWHIDFLQDLPDRYDGFNNCLTATDSATRWFIAVPTKDRSAKTVAKFLYDNIICSFGAPVELVSDRSKSFLNETIEELNKSHKIGHLKTSSYHPRSNGLGERPHQTFNGILSRMCQGDPDRWTKFVTRAVFAMRVRVHSTTGHSPFYLVYGVEPRLPGDSPPVDLYEFPANFDVEEYTNRELESLGVARGLAHLRTQEQADRMAQRYDTDNNVTGHRFQIGEFVKVFNHNRTKFQNKWLGPFIIAGIGPNDSYRLLTAAGKALEDPVHHDSIAEYRSAADLA